MLHSSAAFLDFQDMLVYTCLIIDRHVPCPPTKEVQRGRQRRHRLGMKQRTLTMELGPRISDNSTFHQSLSGSMLALWISSLTVGYPY